jgi:hypothetical protein
MHKYRRFAENPKGRCAFGLNFTQPEAESYRVATRFDRRMQVAIGGADATGCR